MNGIKFIFLNLNTRSKLLTGFVVILLIVVIVEYNEYYSLTRLSQIQDEILEVNTTQRSVKNAKLSITQDVKVMHEMLHSPDNETLEGLVLKHLKLSNSFLADMQNLVEVGKSQSTKAKGLILNSKSQSIINDIVDTYQNQVTPSYEQLKQLKQELFSLEDELGTIRSTGLVNDSVALAREALLRKERLRANKIQIGLNEYYSNIDSYAEQIVSQLSTQLEVSVKNYLRLLEEESANIRQQVLRRAILLILFGALFSFLVAYLVSAFITNQLTKVQKVLDQMSRGALPEYESIDTIDEVGEISRSLAKLIYGLRNISEFAVSIGKSDFSSKFKPLGEQDVLGNSLVEMRKSLQVAAKEEKRRKVEDTRRNWATEGLAKFNVILRQSTDSIEKLTSEVVSELVKYIKANQAGIFVMNDKDKKHITLDLVAAYAYNRKKFLSKSVKLGEGLLGATAVEKYTVYLTEIPQDYLTIESALGGSNPTSLIVVPLKMEEEVYGVMEIASFKEYEPFEIAFIERVAENIASTLSTIKINSKTAELLEQSNFAAKEMHEKENVLRDEINGLLNKTEKYKNEIAQLQKKVEEINYQKLDSDKREEKRMDFIRQQEKDFVKRENLLTSEIKRLKDMINLSHDGMILLNEHAIIQEVNLSVEKILNYETSEILGLTLEHFIEKNFFERINRALVHKDHTLLKEMLGKEYRINIFKKDGVSEEVKVVVQPISASGKIFYVLTFTELLELKAKEVKQAKELDRLMAKEFKYKVKIDELTHLLRENNIEIPEESNEDWLIQWGVDYQLGLEVIDEQHRKWIDIINRFYKSFKEGESNQVLTDIIRELLEYTDYHFGFEERYFKELKFHKTQEHMAAHRKFVNRVIQLQSEFQAGKLDAAYELMNFVKPWVKEHIQIDDRQYVSLFKDHHIRYSMF